MKKYYAQKACVMIFTFLIVLGCAADLPKPYLQEPGEMKNQVAGYQLPKLPEKGKAIIYIVRPSPWGVQHAYHLFLNSKEPDAEMGSTMPKQYVYFDIIPGEHKIFSKAENWAEIDVAAKEGDVIFIQQEPALGVIKTKNKLLILQDDEGKYYVKSLTKGTFSSNNVQLSDVTFANSTIQSDGLSAATAQTQSDKANFKQEGIPAGKAAICLYRPAENVTGGMAVPFGVRVNGKNITTLIVGGYYLYISDPGRIEFVVYEVGFMAPKNTSSVVINAQEGQIYYLRGSHGKGAMGRGRLEPVSQGIGASEISGCKAIKGNQGEHP